MINPGSVGNPRDGDPRAAYAIIDGNKVELKRVEYPVEETIARIDASLLPDRAKQMFRDCYRTGRLNRAGRDEGPAPGPEFEPEEEI